MNMRDIATARANMFMLDKIAEDLGKAKIGIPFLSLFAS